MSMDLGNTESMRKSREMLMGKDETKPAEPKIEVEEVIKFLTNACNNLTDKDMDEFESTLAKLKSTYFPKDFLHILTSIVPNLLVKECFGSKVQGYRILKLLQTYLEGFDKSSFFRTLKSFFSTKSRENDLQTIHNITQVALELTMIFYKNVRFPHKLVSSLVEMIVFALTDQDLRILSEEVLELISNSIGREGLKRIFEIELINSAKLYQIFLHWLDQQQSFGTSPVQTKRETSPIPRKEDIYIEQNETHTLIDDSFSQSFTPNRPAVGQKRQSPTADLKHSFDKALEDAENQDLDHFSQILTEDYLDEPNFGTNIRGMETEQSKYDQDFREMPPVPNLSQFKQSIRSEFGVMDLASERNERKEMNRREGVHERKQSRTILGELQNLSREIGGNFQNLREDFRRDTGAWCGQSPFKPESKILEVAEEKQQVRGKENVRETGDWTGQSPFKSEVKQERRDDSAEKWKGKYLQEKGRLQQTIEMLEKANQSYFNQMSEKNELNGKLNQQKQAHESLLSKLNNLAHENEKLKKEASTFEIEKERLAQQSLIMNSTMFNSKLEWKKMRNQKFITEALPIAAKGHKRDKSEFIKQFQEVLLTSDHLEFEMGETLMKIYEEIEEYEEKVQFVINLKISVSHPQVLENLSVQNHKFLLEIALKLCISENTQKEIILGSDGVTFVETDLTNEMQFLLDALLRFHSVNATLTNLLRILSDQMPTDFDVALTKSQKMILKLTVKCLVKLSSNFKSLVTEDVRVFDVLIEIYKLFKLHPPEALKEGQPNIKDFDVIYRNIRTLADHVIDLGPNKAREFSDFFTRENNKSIFLDYVKSYVNKYYPNLNASASSFYN